MTERLPPERVLRVARLARLALDADEVRRFSADLADVLEYAEVLREVPTDDVPPTAHPRESACSMRADEPTPFDGADRLLRNAPEASEVLFAVPRVVESRE